MIGVKSEGAAGSPPFYGVHEQGDLFVRQVDAHSLRLMFSFEGSNPSKSWGRSSAGRAPALQAGGQEFDSPRLHQLSGL